LDVDWRDEAAFASCSRDGSIALCAVGSKVPIRKYAGHQNEVNCIVWDASGQLLASASDDGTIKIWNCDSDQPVHVLAEHEREISKLAWQPVSTASTSTAAAKKILASGSFDCTVKIWDIETEKSIYSIIKPMHPVTSLCFSPNGEMLATASHDRVHVWVVKDGALVRTFKGDGGVSDVTWDSGNQRVAAALSDGSTVVIAVK